jgi:hypothetical protein
MTRIDPSGKHRRTLEEARSRRETAVHEVHSPFRAQVRQAAWSADPSRVRLDGVGFWVEMWVDAQDVHAAGDIPLPGGLLGSPVAAGLKPILQQAFSKPLT